MGAAGAHSAPSLPPLAACCCAQPQAASASGAILWLLAGCLLGSLGLAACLWAGKTALRSHQRRHRRLQAAAEASWDEQTLRALLGDSLPPWVSDPQVARQPECVNTTLGTLWPHMCSAGSRQAAKGGRLEQLLNSSAVWRPRFLAGASVQLRGFYLGQAPPRISGVKAVQQAPAGGDTAASSAVQDELAFDYTFAWKSDMEVKLLFSLMPEQQAEMQRGRGLLRQVWTLVKRAIVVKVGLRSVVVRGTLRLTLAPLLGDLPVVGAARISLMGMPEFSYETSVLGGNPFVLPGLEAWINSFIRTKGLAPYVFPQGYVLPLPGAPSSAPPRQQPEGLLEVRVLQAVNVPRMDWWGGRADPFVRLWVREESRFRTSVRSHTLSPLWDEQFTLIVHSTRFQSLTLVLYDSDTLLADEEMGQAEVPLHSLDLSPGATNDLWLPIVPPHKQHRRGWKGRRAVAGLHVLGLRRGDDSSSSSSSSMQGGSDAAGAAAGGCNIAGSSRGSGVPEAGPAGLEDTAWKGSVLGHGKHGRQAPGGQSPPPQLPRRSLALRRLTAAVPTVLANLSGSVAGSKEFRLHVQCSFSAFTRQEVEAAMCAGRPGIVTIMRRLSRQSKVPSLLRSGVLSIHLERAEGLVSKTAAGFTRNYKVCIGVGPHIRRVTERGKVDFMHKRNPVFAESLELLVDGETASAEGTLITLEIWSSHFVRKDTFKGRAVVPLREVQRRRRLRGSWPLRDVPAPGGGTLLMELSWTAAAGMY